MTVPPPLSPGAEIAPGYEVVAHLNRARVLDVYDVWSVERDSRAVAKTLRPDRARDRSARRRLDREGHLLRRLAHPHIVRGYDVVGSQPVVVMEMLSGETLEHLIEGSGELSASELAHLGFQLSSAVGYLHRHGVLHLDLKPSNVVAENGRAKLIDLSVARPPGRARGGVGTWSYMSPQQVWGGLLDAAADVWGIGIVLWEAATGEPAFGGEEDDVPASGDLAELPPELHPQLRRRAEPVGQRRSLPEPLQRAIDSALSPGADERPSVEELRRLFEAVPDVISPRSPQPVEVAVHG